METTKRERAILDFIYRQKDIFQHKKIYTAWKIGRLLEKNQFITRKGLNSSRIWKLMVQEGVFLAQSKTYIYDRGNAWKLGVKINNTLEKEEEEEKFRKTFSGLPLISPSIG